MTQVKLVLEKRIQELSEEVKKGGEKYTQAQNDLAKLANDYNVALIKLQEAQDLLAQVVKEEKENAICQQETSGLSSCEEATNC